jgi:hypothetical protein
MPTPSTFYYDSAVFCDATNIWTDLALITPSADGWYQVGGVYRQKLSGALGPCQACPSCGAGFADCDGSVYGAGTTGKYVVNFNVGTGVGAVVIAFNPVSQPDKCTWTYDGLSASEYSSRPYGYRQGVIGDETTGGLIGLTNLLGSNGATYTGNLYYYNSSISSFVSSPPYLSETLGPYLPQATYPAVGGVDLTAGGYSPPSSLAYMVVPKTNPLVEFVQIEVEAPGPTTVWSLTAYCPKSLNPFPHALSGGSCTSLSKIMYTCSVSGNGTNTMLGINDWVFTDYAGVSAMPAGVYPVEDGDGVTKCVTVDANGTITNITTGPCTTNC